MVPSSLLLSMALLTATAAAQTTTVTIPFLGWEQMDLTASIVSANSTATTYSLVCGPPPSTTAVDSDYEGCGLFPTQRLIYGPSTYMMDMGVPSGAAAFTGTMDCGADIGKPTVTCKESFAGSEANFPGSSATEYPGSEVASLKVVVTGGLEKLKAASATATPASASASPTGSAAAASSPSQSPAPAVSKAAADGHSVVLRGGFSAVVVAALGGMFM